MCKQIIILIKNYICACNNIVMMPKNKYYIYPFATTCEHF